MPLPLRSSARFASGRQNPTALSRFSQTIPRVINTSTRQGGSHIFYSDDHGKSWKLGGESDRFIDECEVVERADGSLLMSMRNYLGDFKLGDPLSGSQRRAFATSFARFTLEWRTDGKDRRKR